MNKQTNGAGSVWRKKEYILRELIFAIFAVFRQNHKNFNPRNMIFVNFIEKILKNP